MKEFWQYNPEELLEKTKSQKDGLSTAEAERRFNEHGDNSLHKDKSLSPFLLFMRQLKNPVTIILIFAALVSFFVGDTTESAIIILIILLSAFLSFRQEYTADRSVEELLKLVSVSVEVRRDGKVQKVDTKRLTVGDIITLSAGDLIPSDCALIEGNQLFLDESTLTGETFPVEKVPGKAAATTPLAARKNALWMGTHVVSGQGLALVLNLAKDTEFGKITRALNKRSKSSDFDLGIQKFGFLLVRITSLMIGFIFLLNILLHKPVFDSFMFALALAVGLTPQMLPAIISMNLSKGAKRMAEKKVIVKKLPAVENFGSMTVLCSDKTGTLTEGEVKVGQYLNYQGQVDSTVERLAYLNAKLQKGYKNPIDLAILKSSTIESDHAISLGEIPYSFQNKYLSVLVQRQVESASIKELITKGAFREVLALCQDIRLADGSLLPIESVRENIDSVFEELSQKG
ncbi:cation-translocating P-type ATPase [Streptococcus catagoni]|uniref:cation-translocating P-type ATPase n=1 Tax=Streptococcus catagoni TaxID=2654874 RepID=UPI001A9D6BF3|nr:HAD-IC family P-type ATPase [Streptococcus catagoni]